MSSNADEREISYNEWTQRFQVSSKWDTDTPERRQFMERLDLALEAERMGITKKKKDGELPKVNLEPTLKERFQGLIISCLNLN
jgi:hypothetical protein